MRRKTSVKSAETLAMTESEQSECTATITGMAKMLTDLESKMGTSHPPSLRQRDGAKPLLGKIQAAEKKSLRTRQKAVEASTTKRDQLQLSLQAVPDKLHEAPTQRREQEAELLDLRSQERPRRCAPRRGAKRSWKRWLYSRDAILGNFRSARSSGSGVATTATPPAPALAEASAVDTHFDEVLRKRRDTLDGLLAKFEFNGEVKLA